MVVGVLSMELSIGGAFSLKDKRRVLKGLLERVRNRFNVSCAEVDRMDSHRLATVGVVCVSNQGSHAMSIMSSVSDFVYSLGTVEVLDVQTRVEHY